MEAVGWCIVHQHALSKKPLGLLQDRPYSTFIKVIVEVTRVTAACKSVFWCGWVASSALVHML